MNIVEMAFFCEGKAIIIYIYIYIYILSSTERSVSFYQNSLVWLDILDSRNWDRNPVDSNANPRLYPSATEKTSSSEVNFKRLRITITIVYIHPLNGYRELRSYEETCIYANGTRLLHSLESWTLRELGSIYILSSTHTHTDTDTHTHIHIYIYMCVCVLPAH